LIKSLIENRIEILETNKALIQQRINAVESGAKIEIKITGIKPDEDSAKAISKEIDSLTKQIIASKIDASQYVGGLVFAIKMATIATQEQTLAMLQQRYLSEKYGLAEVKGQALPSSSINQAESSEDKTSVQKRLLLPPSNGPFGLQVGLSKKNIEDMTGQAITAIEGSTDLYMIQSLPKVNDKFDSYGLLISPVVGLCQIRAVGKDTNTDSYGIALRSSFDDLKSSLDSIYGEGKKSDFLLPDSEWKDPQYWMMGLNQKERVFMAEWKSDSAAIKKNNLSSIDMEIRARNTTSGFIYLQYTFNNDSTCEEEIDKAKKSSL
jgi:hypothetical protein